MTGYEIRAARPALGLTQWERGVRSPQGPSVKLFERLLAEAADTKPDKD